MSYGRYPSTRTAFLPSPLFLGFVAVFGLTGVLLWRETAVRLAAFLFVAAGWVISLCLHEYSHAVIAYRGGDRGVAERGYLTLNPLKYTHPLLSIVLPLVFVLMGGIGLPGGAVWVERNRLRGQRWDSAVSFAGPASNLLFTAALVIPFASGLDVYRHYSFWACVAFLAFLQLTAGILNLLPIPGVDGGNLVEPWLSPQWRRGYAMVAPYGLLILFALLWLPMFNGIFFDIVDRIANAIGLPPGLSSAGYGLFRFWT